MINLSVVQTSQSAMRRSRVRNPPHNSLFVLVLVSVLGGSAAVSAEVTESDIEYLIDRVFDRPVENSKEGCAYTVRTTTGSGNERLERYDPFFEDEQAWSLVSINGTAPTAEQLDKYEPAKRSRHPAVITFDFIDNTSLEFVEQTSDELKFSFELRGELGHENENLVENTLFIDPISAQINEIRRKSTESFRVATFARVYEFEAIDTFDFEAETQSVVLATSSVRLRARTGELVVDQSVQRTFSEFDCSTVPVEVPTVLQEDSQEVQDQLFVEPRPAGLDP